MARPEHHFTAGFYPERHVPVLDVIPTEKPLPLEVDLHNIGMHIATLLKVQYAVLTEVSVSSSSPSRRSGEEHLTLGRLIFDVTRHTGQHIEANPVALETTINHIMGSEYGYDCIDAEITFPEDENDLNCCRLDLTFAARHVTQS